MSESNAKIRVHRLETQGKSDQPIAHAAEDAGDEKVTRFWGDYTAAVIAEKVPSKEVAWYVKNAEYYIKAHQNVKLKDQVGEDIAAYFARLLKKRNFEEWQYAQIVDSVRILFQKIVKAPWAAEFPWEDCSRKSHVHGSRDCEGGLCSIRGTLYKRSAVLRGVFINIGDANVLCLCSL